MRQATEVTIGDTYGRLTIVSEAFYKTFPRGSKAKFVDCECACGNTVTIRLGAITSPTKPTQSCGCLQKESIKNLRTSLPVGTIFERLTVIKDIGMKQVGKTTKNYVLVQCECGSDPFEVRVDALKTGNTNSCGCYHRNKVSENSTKHSMTGTTAYSSWQGMKDRCTNPNNIRWDRYGGRGINFPEKWKSFEGFWEDMEFGWFNGADIDRINFDLNYSKDNCRWVNRDIGNHNKSKSEDCTSKYKGVYYDKARDKWVARLNRNKIIYLQKRFNTEIEAATEYDNCSEQVYGDRPNGTLKEVLNV